MIFHLTRNVVQMFIALTLLVWMMLLIAKRYKKGEGVKTCSQRNSKLAGTDNHFYPG